MKHNNMKSNCCSRKFLALSAALATPVMAQEATVLEEVSVTAEHREASLQDTQISISAVSGADIRELGITNTRDLGYLAPNVTMAPSQGGKAGIGVNMRGMGQNETLVTFDPAIGVYIDDVLIAKNVGALTEILDLERIEILRGPQGTLYGRNTMGGTLNYITQKPVDEFGGNITATAGRYGQRDLQGMVNLPLLGADSALGTLNARLVAGTINRDGLTDNLLPGSPNDELETKDRNALMLHLAWTPIDSLDLLYTYDRSRIDEVPATPWATNINPDSTVGPLLQPFAIPLWVDRPESIAVDGPHEGVAEIDGHALHIDYRISDSVTFKSITAVRDMDQHDTADSDGSPLPVLQIGGRQANDQLTQEFRFIGTLDDRLDYTIGLFYMEEDGMAISDVTIFGGLQRTIGKFENKNWALYGQANYALTDQFKLTAGLRYTEEDRQMGKSERFDEQPERIFPVAQRDFDNISPMASISYDWTGDLMTYFKISTGFQSGGFNVRDTNPATFIQGFDEETLLAYELGLKSDINHRVRLNAALWYSDYDDKRVNNFDPETLGNVVRNAGVVEIWGAEVELLAQLSDHFQLGVSYGHTDPEYREYDSPNPGNPDEVIDLSDSVNFPYTPRNTANAFVGYEYPLGFALLKARVDWAYKDDYNFLAPQPEFNYNKAFQLWNARLTLDEVKGPGDTSIRAALWGKNLTDEPHYTTGVNIYDSFGFNINLYGEPRTYGVDFEVDF